MARAKDLDLLETAELAAFVRAVEAGSLSRAAKELGVPRATLGRRLARLEDQLGARLIRRTTRTLVLTDEGRVLYERAKAVLAAVREAASSVGHTTGAIRGRLRVSIPPMIDRSFNERITQFLSAHPEVSLELTATTASVSFGEDGYDLALRASVALDPGLVRRTLIESRLSAVASRAYLARRGTPRVASDLVGHACLRGYARGEHPTNEWPTSEGPIRIDGPLATNDVRVLLDASRAGLGIALLPDLITGPAIAAGELVKVLPGVVGSVSVVAVVYPERKLVRPVVRAFVEELVLWGKEELTKPRTILGPE
jgi:DNA-binding transcriptional LysR family regulator